jgi:hypothetical protein
MPNETWYQPSSSSVRPGLEPQYPPATGGGPKAGTLHGGTVPKPWIGVTVTSSAVLPSGPASLPWLP